MKTKRKSSNRKSSNRKSSNRKSSKQQSPIEEQIDNIDAPKKEIKVKLPSMDVLCRKMIGSKKTTVFLESKMKQYYNSIHSYLNTMSKEEFQELERVIDTKKYDNQKVQLIETVLRSLSKDKYTPKKLTLKKVQPIKGPHPCFPQYTIDRELGSGFQGTVYLAKREGKEYAIKERTTFDPYPIYGTSDVSQKCLQEITIATEMGKLGIGPKVYDSYQCKYKNETKVYLVMEHMTEGNLRTWIKTNKLSRSQKKQIMKQISKMHDNFIFHGDLDIQNIFVTKQKGVLNFKIGDFGMSMMGVEGVKQNLMENDNVKLLESLNYGFRHLYFPIIAKLMILWKLV